MLSEIEIYLELFNKYNSKTYESNPSIIKVLELIKDYNSQKDVKQKSRTKYELIKKIKGEVIYFNVSEGIELKSKEIDNQRLKIRTLYHLIDINFPPAQSYNSRINLIKKALYFQDFSFVFEVTSNLYSNVLFNFQKDKSKGQKLFSLKREYVS